MNKKVLSILMLTVGAAIGSAVTWKVVKTKYEQIAQEEIDSVKGEYANLMQTLRNKLQESIATSDSADQDVAEVEEEDGEYYPDDDERDFIEKEKQQIEYYKLTTKYRSTDGEKNDKEGGNGNEDEVQCINGPYVISPEEFASSPPGYNAQPLDYFADGILADGWGVEIDIEETIGEDALNHFGEYDDDIVYVRNERTEIDYEVSRDPRTYEEAVLNKPNPYYGQ